MADQLTVAGVPVERDSAGILREARGQAQVDALAASIATKADASALPQPATATPKFEMTGGAVGSTPARYAREDHQHPRLTSTTYATLAADGTATVPFTRAFTNKPGVVMTEVEAAGTQPLVCVVQSWVRETMTPTPSGPYVGVVIKGYRSQLLPTLAPIAGGLLLGPLISAVNAINGNLSSANIFGGSASGASVSVIAVARSDVAAT